MKKSWPFTRNQELALVQAAINGNSDARNELYLGYESRIISAHNHSGIGQFPTKFNKSFNPMGLTYREHSGHIFDEVFGNALKTFDIEKASKGAHPFYTHLQSEITFRALDMVNTLKKEQEEVIISTNAVEFGLRNNGRVHNNNDDGNHSPYKAYIDEEHIYDGDAVERHQRKIREAVRNSLKKLHGTRAGTTCKLYLEKAEYGKPVVLSIADQLGIKPGSVYYDFDAARNAMSNDEQDQAQDLLRNAA